MAVNLSPYGGVGAQFLDNSGNVLTGGKIFTYAAGTTTNQVTYTTSAGNIPHSNPIILDASGRVPSGGEIWLTDGFAYKFILRDANDVLIATYDNVTGINSNFVAFTNEQEIQTATAGQTVFNLTTITYQPATNSLTVFVDGVNQYGPGAQYAYLETDGDTVTFVNGLHVGAEVKFTTSQLNSSASQSDAFQVSYTPPFTNSVGTNVGLKLAQTVSVKDFGAVGNGVIDDSAAIQAAINSVAANDGGTVFVPTGSYNLGTGSPALTIPSYVSLVGEGSAYRNVTGKCVEFLYGGSGTVIYAQGLNIKCSNFSINATAPSGTSMIGLLHDGGWYGLYERLVFLNIAPANGAVIKVTSGPVAYGCYVTCFDQIDGDGGLWEIFGRSPSDGITTLTIKDCTGQNLSFENAQGVILNGGYTSNTGAVFYYASHCKFTMLGVDIEGAAPSGITCNDNTSAIKEFGTIWDGWSGTQRVITSGSDFSTLSYGAFSSQQPLVVNTPTLFSQVGAQAYNNGTALNFISDFVLPTNLIGGSQTASRYWKRFNNGTDIIDHQWADHAYVTKAVTTTATSATTIMTIPIPTNVGLRISVFAYGAQIGDAPFANSRNCNVANNAGTLAIVADTQLTALNTGAISFVASGTNLLIQWTPTTVNSSLATFDVEIRGPWTSYS
jgi:hypothetical protein